MKEIARLSPQELRANPVWHFAGNDSRGETLVRAVKRLPVKSLGSTVVATDVVLSSGIKVFALIGNVDAENPRLTQHFVSLSFYREDGAVFHLARYHDFDFSERGPEQLATFLGMKKNEVFPIAWDVSAFAIGAKEALRGVVDELPRERLTRAQIIGLAVP